MGMLRELYQSTKVVADVFEQAAEALDFDLWGLTSQGPKEQLDQTQYTQPAMLASGVACFRAWQAAGGQSASMMAGHSLGEYTALCCAGSIDFVDAIKLVAQRGRLMQSAVPANTGSMAAVLGLDSAAVNTVCDQAAQGQLLQAVNYNAPGQIVIAGHAKAVDRAMELATQAGARRVLKLPVSIPSHCGLMQPAAKALQDYIQPMKFTKTNTVVLHNVCASPSPDVPAMKAALVKQLYSPVLWIDTIQAMVANNMTHIIEMGPGKVLTGLNKRINRSIASLPVFDPVSLDKALDLLKAENP